MTPTERIAAICGRMYHRRWMLVSVEEHNGKRIDSLHKARLAQQAMRMARLESERAQWVESVTVCRGVVRHIAKRMGCDVDVARAALVDLGLWRLVEEARRL